jgi:ketosteroid isomerase-like protein
MTEECTTPDLEEISRKNIEALSRGDLAAGLSLFAPDAVWDDSAVEGGVHEGLAAIREHVEEWMGSYEDWEIVREEFRDLGNGLTLTVAFQKGRPLGSTGVVQVCYAAISIWAEGLIQRFTTYTDIDEARAVGERLAEERRKAVSQERPADVAGGRSIEERVALAMPTFLVRVMFMALARLPPGSYLRRRIQKRNFRRAFEALARDDYEFALLAYEPDVELRVWGEAPRALGLAESYHGHQGFRDFLGDYKQDMNNAHWELEQIVDLGDRLALRTTFVGTGALSGVTMRKTIGIIWRISPRGAVTRQDLYWTWDETLAALQQPE